MQEASGNSKAKLGQISGALSSAVADLARYPALANHAAQFQTVAHDLLLPPLVVVMGTFNAGKSTLLNALLRRKLLPMDVLPSTATVTVLRKGKSGEVFCHAKGLPTRTWPLSDLPLLAAEGNPEACALRQSLSFIEVPLENPLLDKVTLVDTPGLNSPNKAHTRATKDFLDRAQAVLWIVSGQMTLNEQERSGIEQLPPGVKVMVVINQIDDLDPEEDSISRLTDRIKNNLQRPNVSVAAVSAKLALRSISQQDFQAYTASLWREFLAAFETEILQSDPEARLQRGFGEVAGLFEALSAELDARLKEADGYRLGAMGGNEYQESLKQRSKDLAAAERSLVHAADPEVVIQNLKIPADWDASGGLRLKQEVLIGALQNLEPEQSSLQLEDESLEARYSRWARDASDLREETEAYNKSGFFGGPPILFKGKKKQLESRQERLDRLSATLRTEQEALRVKRRAFNEKLNRTKIDCSTFIKEIVAAIRRAMAAVARESQDTVEQQRIAVSKLRELNWLSEFALRVSQSVQWSLPDRLAATDAVDPAKNLLATAFDRFETTLDLIRSAGWGIKITPPVNIPSPLVRPPVQEVRDSTPWILRVATGKRVAIAAVVAVLSIIVLIAWRQTPRESGDRRTPLANQTQGTAGSGPSIPSPVPDLNTVPAGGEAEVKAQPEDAGPTPGTVRMNPKDGLAYVWIPPGSFEMGCSPGDTECLDNEKPPHQVTISKGFWLGQSEVTVYAYKRFSEATGRQMPPEAVYGGRALNPGWVDDAMPISNLIWEEAQTYCSWAGGRLPTEAEWEYAARAGSTTPRHGDLDDIAWNADNSGRQPLDSFGIWNQTQDNYPKRLAENGNGMHEVGQKFINAFGLYDMLGNVWEWLNDWYSEKYYQESPSQDPAGPASERLRTLRGGSWDSPPWIVRASFRGWFQPSLRRPSFGVRCGGEVFGP